MSNVDNLSTEYVKKILASVDPDLARLIVFSGVSLDPNILLKIIVTCVDISYYRNMVHEMNRQHLDPNIELTVEEIASLLENDGWII